MASLTFASTLALALGAAACGAKTGLLVPDVVQPPDVVALDAIDARDVAVCMNGQFALTPRAADVILVIDRSGSMAESLNGTRPMRGNSKWDLLRDALAMTLPLFEDRIDDGALFFPQAGAVRNDSCELANIPDVDVDPGPNNAQSVISVMNSTSPGGATPTAAAMLRAYTWFVRNPNRARARYLVLATDGGPNCNPSLDPATCICTTGAGLVGSGACPRHSSASACLDDMRTVDEIAQIATNPIAAIPTFVIGIASDGDPVFQRTLTSMAIAGGRPNISPSGTPTFYNIQQPGDLITAFTTIQNTIARCSFVTPSRPDNPDGLTLTVNGMPITRDASHTDGWDWTDRGFGEITLFGAACTLASTGTSSVIATVACTTDGG